MISVHMILMSKNADREYALKEREHAAAQNYRNASLGISQQSAATGKYNQRRLEYNDMIAHSQPLMTALEKAIDAGDQGGCNAYLRAVTKGTSINSASSEGYAAKAGQAVNNLQKSLMTSRTGRSLHQYPGKS